MDEQLVKRAKEIIQEIQYITIATASKDGQPWNSPVYSAFDKDYNFYWASDQNGQHSRNIKENENVFLVIYNSKAPEGTGEGVYIKAKAYALLDEREISHALNCLNGRVGKKPNSPKEFLETKPRKIYKAIPEKFWINGDGEIDGEYIDIRTEIRVI